MFYKDGLFKRNKKNYFNMCMIYAPFILVNQFHLCVYFYYHLIK